jgi:hypothetical protein
MDDDDQTACALYVMISDLFNDNKEVRAVPLSNEFHTLVQGDSSIIDYYQSVNSLTNSLRDVGHAILETQLILNLIRGLNPKFSVTADHITHMTPFLSFRKARSMLTLKLSMLTNETKVVSEMALTATASTLPCPLGRCTESLGAHDGGHSGGGNNHERNDRNNCGYGGNGRGGGGGHSGDTNSTRHLFTLQGP